MADIKYLNYGDLQIELLALLNSLSDNVLNYVLNKPWSKKKKERFMSAYQDIMNKGLKGASNTTGQWVIDINDDIDYDSMNDKDKESYSLAALFIQKQMSGIPTKASLENKKDESKLPVFNNNEFLKSFWNHISKDFGGQEFVIGEDMWNYLDKRDSNGIRPRTERAKKLADYLTTYRDNFKDTDYNFENSPFENSEDFKNRLTSAILKLTDSDISNDKEALNRIGLKESDWFNNGSGDLSGKFDANGNELKYGELAEYNKLLLLLKQQLLLSNRYSGVVRSKKFINGLSPEELGKTYKSDANMISALLNYSNKLLGLKEYQEILGAFLFYHSKGRLQNLTKEELEKFKNIRSYTNISPTRLKKLQGVEGLYYDSATNLVILPYKGSRPDTTDLLALKDPKKQAEINMNTAFKDIKEFSPEMKMELEALAWDTASIINPEAFSGSTMALNAARLRGKANPNRSTLDTILDYGTAGLGGILGVGDLLMTGKLGYRLYQLGKTMGSFGKFAGILGTAFSAYGALDAKDSIVKMANEGIDSATPKDLENIAYGLMAILGLKSFASARNRLTIAKSSNPTITEHSISIKNKNGQTHEVKIDLGTAEQIQQIRTAGKSNTKVNSEILNIPKIKESILKYNEINPAKKIEIEGASIINNSTGMFGRSGKNKIINSKQIKDLNAPLYEPVGNKYFLNPGYLLPWLRKVWSKSELLSSNTSFMEKLKNFWSPLPKVINQLQQHTSSPSLLDQSINIPEGSFDDRQFLAYNKNLKYEYNILNTESKIGKILKKGSEQKGVILADGNKYDFSYSKDGTASVILNGNTIFSLEKANQKLAKEAFANFVKTINSKTLQLSLTTYLRRFELKYLDGIRELKRKGFFLKQGGKITDNEIDNFLKQYK